MYHNQSVRRARASVHIGVHYMHVPCTDNIEKAQAQHRSYVFLQNYKFLCSVHRCLPCLSLRRRGGEDGRTATPTLQGSSRRRLSDYLPSPPPICPKRCSLLTFCLEYSTMVFWIFGYGSLVWNPGFEFDEKIIGFIKDYRRVFDLACIDHRGTPEHPARTCTLEPTEGNICWGAAYCVGGSPEKERRAMEYLEHRECEYDRKTLVDFYKEGETLQPILTGVIVFTSTPNKVSNKYYLGPAPLDEMASQIASAVGPSGYNRDYLFLLEKAMFDIGHEDDMVIELANEVRKVLGIVGRGFSNEKKLEAQHHIALKPRALISPLQLLPLAEAVAMDS